MAQDTMILVDTFPVGLLECNCSILADPSTGEAIVVDPGDAVEEILGALKVRGFTLRTILNTHTHIDHVGANEELKQRTGARLLLHEKDVPLYDNLKVQSEWTGGSIPPPVRAQIDAYIGDGDVVTAGTVEARVLHTPGHTPGSLCFHVPGATPLLFSGDTLFAGSVGRWDLWGGDEEQELRSIRKRLLVLEDGTRVIPGHGPATTIGRERRHNPYLS